MSILLDKNPCLEIIVLDEEVILFTSLCFIVKQKKKKPHTNQGTTIFCCLKVKLASLHLSSKLRRIYYSSFILHVTYFSHP